MAGIKFPGLKFDDTWDSLDVFQQADILAYSQIRQVEQAKAIGAQQTL